MPTFVDELPKTNRGRASKYDWLPGLYEELVKNGKAAQLIKGDDFDCTGPSMRQLLYRDTKEHGLKARIRVTDPKGDGREVVTFSVEKDTGEKKGKEQPKPEGKKDE
jgi:hypothetical protein